LITIQYENAAILLALVFAGNGNGCNARKGHRRARLNGTTKMVNQARGARGVEHLWDENTKSF
jgi:hypothetical protein